MKKIALITTLSLLAGLTSLAAPFVPAPSTRRDIAPPAQAVASALRPAMVKISQAKRTADGCPQTAYMALLDESLQNLTILIDNQKLTSHPQFPNSTRLCDLAIRLEVPANMQFAVQSVSMEGYAAIPRGPNRSASMQLLQVINPKTQQSVSLAQVQLSNPQQDIQDQFMYNSLIKEESLTFSNCSNRIQDLNLASQLGTNRLSPAEQVFIEAQQFKLNLVWRTCK